MPRLYRGLAACCVLHLLCEAAPLFARTYCIGEHIAQLLIRLSVSTPNSRFEVDCFHASGDFGHRAGARARHFIVGKDEF